MTTAHNPSEEPTNEVLQQAEQPVPKTPTELSVLSAEEVVELLYALGVHHEALKIQNEELRRLQLELESSRKRLADLYDFAPVGYVTVDAQGVILHANFATAMMLGQERSQIVGTDLALYCDPNSRAELRDHLEKVLTSRTSQSCELRFTTPGGATLDIRLLSNFVETSSTGDNRQCRVSMTDITREKIDAKALRDSESFFRSIFEQAAVGVAQLNSSSGTILRVNRRYCELLGTTAECLVGKTWMELTHPDDLALDLGNMERLRAGDIREFSIEKRMECEDGSFIWIHLTVSPMWQPGEEPSTHIAIVEDITLRKRAEDARRESESRFRQIAENIHEVFWLHDLAVNKVVYASPHFEGVQSA